MKKNFGHYMQKRYGLYKEERKKALTKKELGYRRYLKLSRLRRRLFLEQAGICHYCNRLCVLPSKKIKPSEDWFTIEHIQPVSKGGITSYNNCVGACFSCNTKRNVGSVQDFIQEKKQKVKIIDPVVKSFDDWFIKVLEKFSRDIKSIFKQKCTQ